MKYWTIIFLILSGLNGYSQPGNNYRTKTRPLHAFLFCNTGDSKIGPACYGDLLQMTHELNKIAEAGNFELSPHFYVQEEFTKHTIDSIVDHLQLGQDEVAVFYFSTHGFKGKKDTSGFPTLVLPNHEQVPAYPIYQKLIHNLHLDVPNVGNNLLLTIIDACNRSSDGNQKGSSSYNKFKNEVSKSDFSSQILQTFVANEINNGVHQRVFDPIAFTTAEAGNYFSLFHKHTAAVIITSSKPGQYSYADTTKSHIGSTFTKAFIIALDEQIKHGSGSTPWDKILQATIQGIKEKQQPILEQQPIVYRPFTYKVDFDEPKVIMDIKAAKQGKIKKDSVSCRVSLINVGSDFRFSNNWHELLGLFNGVCYLVYDKSGQNGYSTVPRKIWSYDKSTQFAATFNAKDFKIRASIDQGNNGNVLINIAKFSWNK